MHAASTTFAVVGPSGKRLGTHVVETNSPSRRFLVVSLLPPPRAFGEGVERLTRRVTFASGG
ncbi:MAG TPA: hypothetical protein VF881_14480 [Polyangiaceae bacterium]